MVMSESNTNSVFVVHGHNEFILKEVKEFIIALGLNPIILRDQPNSGLTTLIDKFEKYAKTVSFAVVLMTYDDEGHELGPETVIVTDKEKSIFSFKKEEEIIPCRPWLSINPRARQNVIFEFGYFVALLGRNKVTALCEAEIERPSDIDGVLYIPYDKKGEWKKSLAQDIMAAGIAINNPE